MYKWIIVGGGIHGCTVAVHLLKSGKAKLDELLIIDRYKNPLHKWSMITNRIGMDYLRSPSVHHIDKRPFSLQDFANKHGEGSVFLGIYKRPLLDLFNHHCQTLLNSLSIEKVWHQAEVTDIHSTNSGWQISTNHNVLLESKYVVLALGVNEQPALPEWAASLRNKAPDKIRHIFEEQLGEVKEEGNICIIGGGISAAHLATKLCATSNKQVTLIKRHPFRVHDFDSDPGWLGPKFLVKYHKETDYHKRRLIINQARNRGSVPRKTFLKLRKCQAQNQLEVIDDEIQTASYSEDRFHLSFEKSDSKDFSFIWLATGAQSCLPENQLLEKLIKREKLPCAECGFPIVNKELEWKEGLYVTGALAELEIGPVSRNIAGARKAAAILVSLRAISE
ncbi:FAD/NAD(P)-binding protein [Saliterribacillus persicus]|uniref:NADPH-dependent L-lysine 6-monooxygenase-like protein n=1 Tax=Saliterribacillus persicus TaxID=930114 RepID=A0A368Y823_9BACI|nr:FAD/NAD(P)-binding protein [Saliterribacillus persicus]RCW74977.1 NADPH-dependent L-lysine 6-monooxygenase-like protein [Saliterribacillus persicus]